MAMRVFPRPKKVELEIFGEKHVLSPISYAMGHELFVDFFENNTDKEGGIPFKKFFTGSAETVDKILKAAIPTFTEWESVPVTMALEILDVVIDENDMEKMIGNFFAVRNKVVKGFQTT